MIRRFVRGETAGYTFIELSVTSTIIGMLMAVLMPSLQGYQTVSQLRALAGQSVVQLRQAQMEALATDQQINTLFDPTADLPSRGNQQGFEICTTTAGCGFGTTWATTDPAIARTVVPNNVHVTAYCYRGAFTPTGQYLNWAGVCTATGATVEAMCFDGGGPSPTKIYVTITLATGEVALSPQVAGVCP